MQIAFVPIAMAFVGLAYLALFPAEASALTQFLKQTLGPLGYAISFGVNLTLKLVRYVTRNVGEAILSYTAIAVGWIATTARTLDYIITSALTWPITLSRVFFWLLDVEIPRLIHALPNATTKVFHSTVVRVQKIERTVYRFPKITRAQVRAAVAALVAPILNPYLAPLRWLRAHIHALTATVPATIPLQWGRTISGIRKRLRRLERLAGAGVAVGAVAVALARLGAGWIRCRKVGKVGRQLCGMDESLLDSLLTDGLAIFSVLSVVEFATELRAIEDEAIGIMGKLVREWPG